METYPLTRHLVLIGGGHTHALVLRRWGMTPLAGAQVTLINPGPDAPYTGMLPGFVAGHYRRDELDIDLVRLARFAGARIIFGAADAIDLEARTVTADGRIIPYDVLSIDIGIHGRMPQIPGFAEHAVPAKPLADFADRWSEWVSTDGPGEAAVIGAGVGGMELALAMAHGLREAGRHPEVTCLERGAALAALGDTAAARLRAAATEAGITLRENVAIAGISDRAVRLEGGEAVPARFVVGAAGARPYGWLARTGLALADGYIEVDPQLRSSDRHVFACGDCAHIAHAPRPKAGVFAVRAAPVLFHNLRAALMGRKLARFDPQKDFLKLISLGGKSALAEKWSRTFSGPLMWRWKDRIDRRFMNRFTGLVPMEVSPPPDRAAGVADGGQPLCGGCGSKVARGALAGVMAEPTGDDAALIEVGGRKLVFSTDHLRGFWNDPHVMARVAAVHALGDVLAKGGVPGAALASVTLPRMSAEMQARWMHDIMSAARAVFAEAGGEILGGHSSLGAELSIGFSVTGDADRPVRLDGGRPGDLLILTKPIGTGVIMAAEMALRAPGRVVRAALAQMCRLQMQEAKALGEARAMTDVTGFGLAGHLAGLCDASGTGAEVRIADVPLIDGALALSQAGVRSSIYPDNRAISVRLPEGPVADLMADPQTAGGFLAAVEPDRARGLPGWIIGRLTEPENGVRFL